jgi:glutamate-1-semialdehyde 2,1-aminomutase
MNARPLSARAYKRAAQVIPGGVNSPVRAFKGVGGDPVFFSKGAGAWLFDIDGNRYLDFVGSWGPLILGHAFPTVIEEIRRVAPLGATFGAPTERETELAELIRSMAPSMEMVRLVNSGTEATMSAIRLARGITGRDLIVKFEGCYHGHGDSFLIAAGSGATTFAVPDSPGVPAAVARNTLIARYNDIGSVQALFAEHGDTIAALIVEPVAGNMGVVLPAAGFLPSLRDITKAHGALLIFDEVMTGFRLSPGGAQSLYNVRPDITTFGKIVGGGLPIGAYGGSRKIMSHISPLGPVYQAGTLSGNPIAVAAGCATLKILNADSGIYTRLERAAHRLASGVTAACADAGIPCVLNRAGSMMTLFFTTRKEVVSYPDAASCDTRRYARFFHAMLDAGVYLPPSQFEAWFVSAAHTDEDLDRAVSCCRAALDTIREST